MQSVEVTARTKAIVVAALQAAGQNDIARIFEANDILLYPATAKLEVAVHVFNGGDAVYPYWRVGRKPTLATLKRKFDIDFDPDSGEETINLETLDLNTIEAIVRK